jgi:hypothetical protein
MKSRTKLVAAVGAVVGASLLAFCGGLLLTVLVIVPAREGRELWPVQTSESTIEPSPSVEIGPVARRTPTTPPPASTHSPSLPSPTPRGPVSSPVPLATSTPTRQPTTAPPPTATPRYSFAYVEGSRVEELQCTQPYLQGWVRDASGAPLNGVTIRWQYLDRTEDVISGDVQFLWRDGEFKFTYFGAPGRETEFVLQVIEGQGNPNPLSEPLVIHYAGCATTGQITNIVFKQR